MTPHAQERGLVTVRWEPNDSVRVRSHLESLARQFADVEIVEDPRGWPHRAVVLVGGPSFTIGETTLEIVKRLYEDLVTSGVTIRAAADLAEGEPSSFVQVIESLRDGLPDDFVALGSVLAERLPEDGWRELARRSGGFVYPCPPPERRLEVGADPQPPARLPHRFVRLGTDRAPERAVTSGLLEPSRVEGARPLDVLLRAERRIIVVGEPWIGKSFCARALHADRARALGPDRVFLLDLRHAEPSLPRFGEAEHLVIVDGADEVLFQEEIDLARVFAPALDPNVRDRVRLLVFTRDDEGSLKRVLHIVEGAIVYRLLPIDAVEATRKLGSDAVARALARAAGLPASIPRPLSMPMLEALASEVEPALVMESLLAGLCRDGIPEELASGLSIGDLLSVAERLAATTALTGKDDLALELRDWTAARAAADRPLVLRALARSAIFVRGPSTQRFRSRHTRDLLAARGLGTAVREAAIARSLLVGASSQLHEGLEEVVKELRALPERPAWVDRELGDWANAKPSLVPEQQALELLDRFLSSGDSWLGRHGNVELLHRIDHPSVRTRALEVLRDREEATPAARALALQLAELLEWTELDDLAIEIALADGEAPRLRQHAVYALGDTRVEALRPLIDVANEKLRELALDRLTYSGRLPVLEMAARSTIDHVQRSLASLAARMSEVEARSVLARHAGALNEDPVIDSAVLRSLLPAAMEKLAGAPWDDTMAPHLANAIGQCWDTGAYEAEQAITERLRDSKARKLLYRWLVGERLAYVVGNELTNEDADWLLQLASEHDPLPTQLANDLGHYFWTLASDDARLERIRALLAERAPRRLAEIEEARRAGPERRAEQERWKQESLGRAQARAAGRKLLRDVLDEVLREVIDPTDRLRLLSELCFVDGAPELSSIAGSFARLPVETRTTLISEVRALARRAEPASVPTSRPFPSVVLTDAAAFRSALLWNDDVSWLDDASVRAWLPLVFFDARYQRSEVAREAVTRCFDTYPDATREVAIEAVRRDAALEESAYAGHALPQCLWQDRRFLSAVLGVINDESVPALGRKQLVELAAARGIVTQTRPLLLQLAGAEGPLQNAAIAALVVVDPDKGIEHANGVAQDLQTLAPLLEGLTERFSEVRRRFGDSQKILERASTHALEQLAQLLFRHVPYGDPRPQGQPYSPSAVHDLYELRRDVVLPMLVSRPDFHDDDALLACLESDAHREELRQWIAAIRGRYLTASLLEQLRPSGGRPTAKDVLDALEGSRRVRFRSVDDLLFVLSHGLRRIAQSAHDDIELLRGTQPKGGVRKEWPHERTLQAYVLLRAREILASAGKRAGVNEDVIFYREPQESAGKDRPDFVAVRAPPDGGGELLDLPIEVKWSHNKDWRSALSDQLGKRYVLDKPPRMRGLYVVGFTGKGRTKTQKDLEQVRQQLEAEAERFAAEHTGIRLEVVVLRCEP